MGFEVPIGSDFDPSDSVYLNSPGRYHLIVVDCDEDGMRLGGRNNKGEMVVEFECLAGSVPNQEGMRHRSYFTKSAAAAWKIMRLALAAGLITAEEVERHKQAGTYPMLEFERDLKGKQIFAELVENTNPNNGKVTARIKGGMYFLASKQCANKTRWPRNEAMITKSGIKMPPSDTTPSTAAKQPNRPAAQSAKPQTQDETADDLLSGVV